MKFIITNDQSLHEAKDELVVVIDVLRAFTTACYVMNTNPKDYIVLDSPGFARKLKEKHPDYILVGERNGTKLPGFDYDSSPTEVENIDFSNKTIVHTTTLGTKGIVNALNHTKEVITGSFANAGAIINYIKKEKPNLVYLFPTDSSTNDNEDVMFAKYVKGYFVNKQLSVSSIKQYLATHKTGRFYLNRSNIEYFSKDFSFAFEANKFNFVIKAYLRDDRLIHLKKIE